jgi:hypothetical protein
LFKYQDISTILAQLSIKTIKIFYNHLFFIPIPVPFLQSFSARRLACTGRGLPRLSQHLDIINLVDSEVPGAAAGRVCIGYADVFTSVYFY